MKLEITRQFTFEAAHHLPSVGPGHKCSRLHGHLFKVEVSVAGALDPSMGWVMDFGDLAAAGSEVIDRLDHTLLNDVPGLGVPTSENIARYIFVELSARVPGLSSVTVHESPHSKCTYRPGEHEPGLPGCVLSSAWGAAGRTVSAAHFLVFPPDARETVHGHDYRVQVEANVLLGRSKQAGSLLSEAAGKALEEIDRRLLLPSRPAAGRLVQEGAEVVFEMADERIVIPARDCAVIDAENTTTEAIALVLARRIAGYDEIRGAGYIMEVTVRIEESGTSSARVTVEVPAGGRPGQERK